MLIGQNNNLVPHHRGINAMNNLLNTTEVKSVLKEKALIIANKNNDELFGKAFCDQLKEKVSTKKQFSTSFHKSPL